MFHLLDATVRNLLADPSLAICFIEIYGPIEQCNNREN
jgi:hypothetical protein